MKAITKYQDDRGQEWDTAEQAIRSDAEYTLNSQMQDYVLLNGTFNTKMWLRDVRSQPEMYVVLREALGIKPKNSTGMWKDNKWVKGLR